jgi:L-asparagine oxygenase
VLTALKRDGFSLRRDLTPSVPTIEVAQALGTVVSVSGVLPSSGIPTVQCLRPRNTDEARQNHYSGHYGLGAFPLHTDLAHWGLPPRYLLLRCIVGSSDVFTHILPWAPVVDVVWSAALRRAVLTARRRGVGCSGLVRAMSQHGQAEVLRWDPIFLRPLNRHARALATVMLDRTWDSAVIKVLLRQPGDTVLIDNWRMLHGRGQVLAQSTTRRIDRVYLSGVFQ